MENVLHKLKLLLCYHDDLIIIHVQPLYLWKVLNVSILSTKFDVHVFKIVLRCICFIGRFQKEIHIAMLNV